MDIQCTQENFSKHLQTVGRIASNRTSLPILSNVHLFTDENGLRLAATDLEIGITTWLRAKVKKNGAITLPARLLTDFITSNNDPTLNISLIQNDVTIQSEKYKATIKGMSAADFPIIPSPGKEKLAIIESKVLKSGLQDVLYAAALNDSRPVLNGIFFSFKDGYLTLVSTDSYRLAERIIPFGKQAKEYSLIAPVRLAGELIRILPDSSDEVNLTLNENQLSLEFLDTQIVSRLIEGSFPEYKQIIPQAKATEIIVEKSSLLNAVKISDFFARDAAHNIKFKIEKKQLLVTTSSSQLGQNTAQVTAEVHGELMEIAFNAKFILDALNAVREDKVCLKVFGSDRPMVIEPLKDENYFNLVMPLRID